VAPTFVIRNLHLREPADYDPNEIYVAVAETKWDKGVYSPGRQETKNSNPQTFDWRKDPGSPENTVKIRAAYEVLPLLTALRMVWHQDAHMCASVLFDRETGLPLEKQPRINLESIPWLYDEGFEPRFRCLINDIDNPGHVKSTDEMRKHFQEVVMKIPELATCVLYETTHGYRIVQPLTEWYPAWYIPEMQVERIHQLHKAGIDADPKCLDQSRLFRMAKIMRTDPIKDDPERRTITYQSHNELINAENMQQVVGIPKFLAEGITLKMLEPEWLLPERDLSDLPPVVDDGTPPKPRPPRVYKEPRPRAVRAENVKYETELYPHLDPVVDILARALAENWDQQWDWHKLYLHLSGAFLVRYELKHEMLQELIRQIAEKSERLAGSKQTWVPQHMMSARTTVSAHISGSNVSGFGKLYKNFRPIADAFNRATIRGDRRRLYNLEELKPAPVLEDARTTAIYALSGVGGTDECLAIEAQCGTGKTHAAVTVVCSRSITADPDALAKDAKDAKDAKPSRAKDAKSSISFDKNSLAIEWQKFIAKEMNNVPTKRFRGSASVLKVLPDGNTVPECVYIHAARALANGGQSVLHHLCDGVVLARACLFRRVLLPPR